MQTANNSDRDERLKELMEGYDAVLNDLENTKTQMADIENEIKLLRTGQQTRLMRASTPLDTSGINQNKNLKIPTFVVEPTDKPLKYLKEIKEYAESQSTTDFKIILTNSLKKNGLR